MAREHPDYRNNIEQLNRYFPDKEMLTAREIMPILGYKSETSVRANYPMTRGKISKAKLARLMCD